MGALPKFLQELERQRPGIVTGSAAAAAAAGATTTTAPQQGKRRRPDYEGSEGEGGTWSDEDKELERAAIQRALHEAGEDDDSSAAPQPGAATTAPATAAAVVAEDNSAGKARAEEEPEEGEKGKHVFRPSAQSKTSEAAKKRAKPTVQAKAVPENRQLLSFDDDE